MPRKAKYRQSKRVEIGNRALATNAAGRKELMDSFEISKATLSRYVKEAEGFASKGSLFSETGTTGLSRFGGSVKEDYDQSWDNLVDLVALVKEMLNHPIVSATMYALETSIKRVEWSVIPGGEGAVDLEVAEFVKGCMHDMSHTWEDHTSQLLSMLAYGFAPFEVVYKRRLGPDKEPASQYDDGKLGWRKLAFRSQDTLAPGNEWEFDDAGGVQGMNQQAPPDWTPKFIPIEKMILYRTTAAKNNPQGHSVLRSSFIPWYFSKNMSEIEGIAAERTGTGIPVLYMGDGTNKAGSGSDFAFAKQIVRDVRSDEQEGIAIPYPKQTADGRGVLFELISPPSRGLINFEETITRYNQQITQTLLAQFIFLGLTRYGTQSLAAELRDFFAQSVEGWLITIAGTINRFLIPRLIRVNGFTGLTTYPKLDPGDVGDTDMGTLLTAIGEAVASGTLIPDEGVERRVRQVLRVPDRDSIEAGKLLMDMPGGKQPLDPNAPPIATDGASDNQSDRLQYMSNLAEQALQYLETDMMSDTHVTKSAGEVHIHNEPGKPAKVVQYITQEAAKPADVHVDANIEVQAAKSPDVNVDANIKVQPADVRVEPNINVHPARAPDVHVQVDEHIDVHQPDAPDIYVEKTKVDVNVPKIPIDITVKAPDEVVETESVTHRDAEGLVAKIIRISRRKGK